MSEYTETRRQFAFRAIITLKAIRAITETLIAFYTAHNGMTDPTGGTTPPPGGHPAPGGGADADTVHGTETFDAHHPYLVFDVIHAIDKLIEFTERVYIRDCR